MLLQIVFNVYLVFVRFPLASTPLGMPGTHPLQYFSWGRQWEYPHQYYYVRSDISRPRPMTTFNGVFYEMFCSKIQDLPQNRPKPHWGSSR